MQPRKDSTGFFVRGSATAGLPGRDAATTGLDGIFDESNALELGSVPSIRLILQQPRLQVWPQEDNQVQQTDSWSAAPLATASLGFMLRRSRPCVCRLLRARTSLGYLKTKERGFFGVSRCCAGVEGDTH